MCNFVAKTMIGCHRGRFHDPYAADGALALICIASLALQLMLYYADLSNIDLLTYVVHCVDNIAFTLRYCLTLGFSFQIGAGVKCETLFLGRGRRPLRRAFVLPMGNRRTL